MATDPTDYPVPGEVFHHREGIEFPDDVRIMPERGRGPYIWTESGHKYLDYMMGSGPALLGHAHPTIVDAVSAQVTVGTSFYKTERTGLSLANRIVEAVPCAEALKFTSSGGEATYYALRLARAHTDRTKIVKFRGGYHGFHDAVLRSSDKGPTEAVLGADLPDGTVDTHGAVPGVTEETLVAPFNDPAGTREIIESHGDEIAGVILEPVQRSLPATEPFLNSLREVCDEYGIVLIFDEVVTGFRLAMGGAQEWFGVEPDLATYGKAIGGGTPIGAVAGDRTIMDRSNPSMSADGLGAYVSGTLSGNPLSAAAGHAVLDVLETEDPFDDLIAYGDRFREIIVESCADAGIAARPLGVGPIVDYVVTDEPGPITDWRTIATGDAATKAAIDRSLLAHGQLQHVGGKRYISTEHGDRQLAETATAYPAAIESADI